MAYDDILKEVGGWGPYQKWICFLLAVSGVPNGYFSMIMVFTSKTPEHRCRILEIDGAIDANSTDLANFTAPGLDDFIPWEEKHGRYERCRRYVHAANISRNETPIEKCDSYVYDVQPGERTAITDWDLVCDQAHIKPRITSTYLAGVLVGSLASGILADWFGRWCLIVLGTYTQFLFMVLSVFCQNPQTYAFLMFTAGVCGLMNFVGAVVLGAEITDTQHRALLETAMMVGFAIGYMILPVFAYFIINWKMMLLAMGLTGIVFIPYWWLIPESPRWLITRKKLDKAKVVLKAMAKRNGSDANIDSLLSEENLEMMSQWDKEAEKGGGRKFCLADHIPYVDLFTKPGMLIRTLCICCSWWIISMIYYTMNLNTGNMGGNDIINCFVFAAVELPAYLSVYFILRKRGRRWLMVAYMLLSAALCGITPFLAKWNENAAIVSAMCGKFLVTSAFSLVYLFTTELFPTEVRNQAVGIGSMSARLGSIASPYIIFWGESVSNDLPYIVTGCLAFITGLIDIFLPETRGISLADTFEEANALKRSSCFPIRGKKRRAEDEESKIKA